MDIFFLITTYLQHIYDQLTNVLVKQSTSNLELRAAHSPELAVDRVDFFNQGDQDGVTDPLQKTQICFQKLNCFSKFNSDIESM